MKGTCLCGAVRYLVTGTPTAFDLCHCSRWREASGSAFIAELVFEAAKFEWVSGRSLVKTYEAPVRVRPPGYRRTSAGYAVDRRLLWTGATSTSLQGHSKMIPKFGHSVISS